eukprot:2977210-Prymnesium_polylepis.1
MPRSLDVTATPAVGFGLYPRGLSASTLRLKSFTMTPFGNEKVPSAPHAGMWSESPCSLDARPSASST